MADEKFELSPQEEMRVIRGELTAQINSVAHEVKDVEDFLNSLHDDLHEAISKIMSVQARMDQLVASHNAVGENVAWLVANTQGLFQMFNDPKLINQVMGGMLGGGMFGGGQQQPDPES